MGDSQQASHSRRRHSNRGGGESASSNVNNDNNNVNASSVSSATNRSHRSSTRLSTRSSGNHNSTSTVATRENINNASESSSCANNPTAAADGSASIPPSKSRQNEDIHPDPSSSTTSRKLPHDTTTTQLQKSESKQKSNLKTDNDDGDEKKCKGQDNRNNEPPPPPPPEEETTALQEFLDRIRPHPPRQHLHQRHEAGEPPAPPIDITRARYLLEASAGNVSLAVALYWDDYIANAVQNDVNVAPPPPHDALPGVPRPPEDDGTVVVGGYGVEIEQLDRGKEETGGVLKQHHPPRDSTSTLATSGDSSSSNQKVGGAGRSASLCHLQSVGERMRQEFREEERLFRQNLSSSGGGNSGYHIGRNLTSRRGSHRDLVSGHFSRGESLESDPTGNRGQMNEDEERGADLGDVGAGIAAAAESASDGSNNNNNGSGSGNANVNNDNDNLAVAARGAGADRNNESASVSDDEAAAERLLRKVFGNEDLYRYRNSLSRRNVRRLKRKRSSISEGADSNDEPEKVRGGGDGDIDDNTAKEVAAAADNVYRKEALRAHNRAFLKGLCHYFSSSSDDDDDDCDDKCKSINDGTNNKRTSVSSEQHKDEASDKKSSNNDSGSVDSNDNDSSDNFDDFVDDDEFAEVMSVEPSRLLWGTPTRNDDPNYGRDGNRSQDNIRENNAGGNQGENQEANGNHGNPGMIEGDTYLCHIPRTWLSSAFTLSSCGTGLALSEPQDEELIRLKSIQTAQRRAAGTIGSNSAVPPLPPHHCGGVTALLSLVTALLYSGASIQGNEVNCNSCKVPFSELSIEERQKEFPQRLADALSAILFVAAQTGAERRNIALASLVKKFEEKRKKRQKKKHDNVSDDDFEDEQDPPRDDRDLMMRQLMRVRARLCPVCRWELEDQQGEPRITLREMVDNEEEIRITVSYTNIEDLREYVISNLRSFMSEGGCALLLETILHIHGVHKVSRMVHRIRKKYGKKEVGPLIECNCHERQKCKWEKSVKKNINIPPNREDLQMPPGHDCMSIELLGLIITGSVQSDLKNWSAEQFGVGLLSTDSQEGLDINLLQKYPPKPIWIIRGITCYTTLWNEQLQPCNNLEYQSNFLGDKSDSFRLVHWNSWYYIWSKISMRVIPARNQWETPRLVSNFPFESSPKSSAVTKFDISRKRRLKNYRSSLSRVLNHDKEYDTSSTALEEIEKVVIHPEDKKCYPKEFHRWRFTFSPANNLNLSSEKKTIPTWVPYFRLNKHQKEVVERELASRINLAVWNRWPEATVDDFRPVGSSPPIV